VRREKRDVKKDRETCKVRREKRDVRRET